MPNLSRLFCVSLKFPVLLFLTACAAIPPSNQDMVFKSKTLDASANSENYPREPQSKQPRLSIRNTHNPQIEGPNDCTHAAFPDPKYTPGATFPDLTEQQLCTPGYTATVRNVTDKEARQVFVNYGLESKYLTEERGNYEVDHFISLELGGNNDVSNLWPEPYEPKPGARQKDIVETSLHHRVCAKELTLGQAQEIIKHDWCAEYLNIVNKQGRLIKIDTGMPPEGGLHPGSILVFTNPSEMNLLKYPHIKIIYPDGSSSDLKPE